MKLKDRELTPNELFLSLHGTLMALIAVLHQGGHLPEQDFLRQMLNSEKNLYEEGFPYAAHLLASYRAALSSEWERESPSR